MCGTGIGFSVERQFINSLPVINEDFYAAETVIQVHDSRIGWATSFRQLIALLYAGQIPRWDLSKLRPKGARLKTFGGRACLTGDTIVYRNDGDTTRGRSEITLKQLFEMKHSQGFWEHKPNHFKETKLRSLDEKEGVFFKNRLIDIIDNGDAPVYEIVTKNGYRIKATGNHRFMNDLGEYQELDEFKEGDLIAVNGSDHKVSGKCCKCGVACYETAIRCRKCNLKSDEVLSRLRNLARMQMRDDCNLDTARSRKCVKDYRASKTSCEVCGVSESMIRLETHHQDRNPHNSHDDNLLVVCPSCHRKEDMKRMYFGNPYSCRYLMFDEIISIEYAGVERVYDLVMQGPNHNFIANGFVSHNSGPEPLNQLFQFCVDIFKKAAGRKLNSVECHDIVCKIADIVVVGGVRRSALISLSNLSDDRMRNAKTGQWWIGNPQRALANNSAAYTEKPEIEIFLKEWLSLIESKCGERGIFNRVSATKKAAATGRRKVDGVQLGTNPCGEIYLRSAGLCNLSEVVIRPDDSLEDLCRKVEIATVIGTYQSLLTEFRYIRTIWKKNAEEERLLGVSLTGIMDHPILSKVTDEAKMWLTRMREVSIQTNKQWSNTLGIEQSVACTCVKPSGCQGLDNVIKTSKGEMTMRQLYERAGWTEDKMTGMEREWLSANLTNFPNVYDENGDEQEITGLFVNGVEPVYEIEFRDGNIYKFTGNHQLLTTNGWKRVDELTGEDDVVSL